MAKKNMNVRQDSELPDPPKRIETQIHRRKKAKAVSPLIDEWRSPIKDVGDKGSQSGPPKGLKRPPQDMRKANTQVRPY